MRQSLSHKNCFLLAAFCCAMHFILATPILWPLVLAQPNNVGALSGNKGVEAGRGIVAEMTPREMEKAKTQEKARSSAKKAPRLEEDKSSSAKIGTVKALSTKVAGPHPGGVFDLSHWKLTLPYNEKHEFGGHAKEIAAERLVAGFKDPHFYLDERGAMVFWCPVIGARTEGTKYPRCELREMLEPGNPDQNWTMSGLHILEGRCRMVQIPSYPKVVIGQIHSYTGKRKPLVKLQYHKGRVEALVKVSPFGDKDKKLTFSDLGSAKDVDWRIMLKEGALSVTVNGSTQVEDMMRHDKRWADQSFYFKAGAYPQENEGDADEGARVSFSHLQVRHQSKDLE